jgi:hypothetical protein
MMLIGRLEQVRIVHFGLFQTHSLSDFSDPGAQVRANRSNACATGRIGRALDRGRFSADALQEPDSEVERAYAAG